MGITMSRRKRDDEFRDKVRKDIDKTRKEMEAQRRGEPPPGDPEDLVYVDPNTGGITAVGVDESTAASSAAVSWGGVFISYRRQETSDLAGRLYDRLADRFGQAKVFMDVDTIEPGTDFTDAITQAVGTCQVLVAVIGPQWLAASDKHGRRRLDNPDDLVRVEVEAALARGVRVIPLLAGGAEMPQRQELPDSLGELARRHALVVRHDSFRSDVARLITAIERVGTG
jgi:hypothetical protein